MHQVPWNFPNEILSTPEVVTIIRFLSCLSRMLPCSICSRDALEYQKSAKLLSNLRIRYRNPRTAELLSFYTRAKVAQYLFDLHNHVNIKLGKLRFGTNWRDSLKIRPKWQQHLFCLLFAITWRYPVAAGMKYPRDSLSSSLTIPADWKTRTDYEYFFREALPPVLSNTPMGRLYRDFIRKDDVVHHLRGREDLFEWLYSLKVKSHALCGATWQADDVRALLEAFVSRKDCSSDQLPSDAGCH